MISKINKIKNVGRFFNSTPSNITLNRDILIYGRNTHGKSTFTSILHSLKENNPEYIIGRKTIPSTGNQEIVIELSGHNYQFLNNRWSSTFKDIEIFDTKFISDNISHVEQITCEQQNNLNQIVLGEKGKEINDKIKKITEEITADGIKKSEITRRLKSQGIEDSISKINELEQIENIDEEINKISNEILKAKYNEEIKRIKGKFFKIELLDEEKRILFDPFKVDNTLVEKHVLDHYPDNIPLDNNFTERGIELSKKGFCALCGNNFNEKLLNAYRDIFSAEYKKNQEKLTSLKKRLEKYNFHIWAEIVSELLPNGIKITNPDISFLENKKREIIDLVDSKISDFTKSYTAENAFKEISRIQEEFSKKLEEMGTPITPIPTLEKKRKELELNKKIFSEEIIALVEDYNSLERESSNLEKNRKEFQEELNSYCEDICSSYKEEVNSILNEIHSAFKLDNFKHLTKLRGNDDYVFDLNIGGCSIPIYESNNSKPNFKNTLSESDKKALAFAFFVVKMRKDKDLDKKIIVFDDPISSFDRERKLKTAELILNLKNDEGKRPLQKIILTHEEVFLMDIYAKSKALGHELGSIKICSGDISSCNFEEEFSEGVIKDLERLYDLKENYHGEDFDKEARRVLENIFKRKYFPKVKEIKKTNASASVRSFIMGIYKTDDPRREKGLSLCESLHIDLHDNPERNLSDGDKEIILNDFLKFIEEV
ncbi:MAG: AAA family ATPase [Candidatus Pacearchaeota archaeon]